MKRTLINTAAGAWAAALLCGAGTAWAQTPAQIHMQQQQQNQNMGGMIQSDNVRNCGNPNGCARNSGPSAAERREWHRREARIQAEIAELRRTPFWMALAWNFDNGGIIWPGGFRSEQRAVERAKQICTSSNCHVVATFNNTCAHFVSAVDRPRSMRDFFVAYDRDGNRAMQKAIQACEAVHGKREDRCFSAMPQTPHGEGIFCVGYDYSLYNQD